MHNASKENLWKYQHIIFETYPRKVPKLPRQRENNLGIQKKHQDIYHTHTHTNASLRVQKDPMLEDERTTPRRALRKENVTEESYTQINCHSSIKATNTFPPTRRYRL